MVAICSQAVLLYALISLGLAKNCIGNYDDLKKSILSNPENVYNLTRGFYSANQLPTLWIDVNYISQTDRNTTSQQHDVYTFHWSSSPVLLFAHHDFLELWSLQSITFETNFPIDIVILPFCNNVDRNTKLNLLNYATVWVSDSVIFVQFYNNNYFLKLKSYAEARDSFPSSLNKNPDVEGYSAYKTGSGNFIVIGSKKNYESYIYSFIAGTFLFVVMCEIVTPIYVYNQYINLHEKSILDLKWSGQNFRFKSFIWATGTVLMIVDLFAIALDVYKFTITPLRKTSNYSYVFYMFVGGGIVVLLINTVVSVVIIIKRKEQLIELPKPFLILTKQNQKCQCIIYFAQYLFIMTVLIFALFTFHATGIFVAILVDPVTVLARLSLGIIVVVFSLFMFTYVYEMCEKGGKNYCKAILYFFVWITFTAIIILIGRTYILATIFSDNTGVFHSFGQIFPAILLAITGWLVKREYDNFYFVKEFSNDQQIQIYNELV